MTVRDIRSSLKELTSGSTTYDKAYDDAMQRIDSQPIDQKKMAREVLSWITCAKRPLTPFELLHALAVDLGDPTIDTDNIPNLDFIVLLCVGLVVVTGDEGPHQMVRLVHYTTQEYFERLSGHWFPDAHKKMAATCLTYLSFDNFQSGICATDMDFEARLDDYPLYSYAATNWGHHVSAQITSQDLVTTFLRSSLNVDACVQAIFAIRGASNQGDYCRRIPQGFTALHLAAFLGLEDIVRSLIGVESSSFDIALSDRSPLGWAAYAGHVSVVEFLLNSGFDPRTVDINGRAILSLAAYKGQASVIVLLLSHKVDPNYSDSDGQTPLLLAVDQGHEEATRVLLENGAVPDCRDNDGQTPLFYAASNGLAGIAHLLLTRSADPNYQDIYGRTPLSYAAENAYPAIFQSLLLHGARLDLSDVRGSSPLIRASLSGQQDLAHPFRPGKYKEDTNWEHMKTHRTMTCPICPFDRQMMFTRVALLKRHIVVSHFAESQYVCRESPCVDSTVQTVFSRQDHFAEHLITRHGQEPPVVQEVIPFKERLPSPQNCPVCKTSLSSWEDFWTCIVHHA